MTQRHKPSSLQFGILRQFIMSMRKNHPPLLFSAISGFLFRPVPRVWAFEGSGKEILEC